MKDDPLEHTQCLCGSNNWKCFEFEKECIIAKCMDCDRFECVDLEADYGIQSWSNGTIYFSDYDGLSPRYEYDGKEVIRVRGRKKIIGIDNTPISRKIYYYDKAKVIKNYLERIKHYENKIKTFKKDLEKVKNR